MSMVGKKAPAFKLEDQNGKMISLKDLEGKKVILYFYPKDDTPACTANACDFRDNYSSLKKKGFVILGISKSDMKAHIKFSDKYELPFSILHDVENKIADKYGVFVEKSMFGKKYMGIKRTTFIIDEKGKLIHMIEKVDTANASAQVLEILAS